MTETAKKSIMVCVVVLAIALIAGAFVYTRTDYLDQFFGKDDEVIDVDNNNNDVVSQETIKELAFLKRYTNFLKSKLSQDTQDSLVVVVNYVDENPNVLDDTKGLILPSPVEVALAKVKLELLQEAVDWGEAEASDDTDTTDDTTTDEDTTDDTTDTSNDAVAGEQVVITGVLEDYAGENPFGATYQITDQTTGMTYYFAFGETTVNNINSENMVGQVVDITVEMTGEGQEFTVVSGPTLVVEENTVDDTDTAN